VGFEPTTPGLEVRDPSDEPGTQAPAAGIRARVPIDEASLDDLPEKQQIISGRPVPASGPDCQSGSRSNAPAPSAMCAFQTDGVLAQEADGQDWLHGRVASLLRRSG